MKILKPKQWQVRYKCRVHGHVIDNDYPMREYRRRMDEWKATHPTTPLPSVSDYLDIPILPYTHLIYSGLGFVYCTRCRSHVSA